MESGTAALILFSPEKLMESFGTGINSSFMINNNGDYLIYSDDDSILAGANASNKPFVQYVQENPQSNRLQTLSTDENGVRFFSAFSRLSFPGVVVITSVEYDNVFAQVSRTTRSNIFLTIAVLFASVILTWFFSKSISVPIKALAGAAGEIEQGNFDIKLKAKTKDELGLLTESFVHMGKGLAERERLKDTFGRFINKDIAEKAMKGELTLGGENKHVTIFFSDIRSFTAISEKLEPHEVVEFLNEYMTKMVKCVNDTHGVVDKFIGDAVMAIWGAPISTGDSAADALNCVRSALMMRAALLEFNKGRGGDKKPIIKIGCGINTGDVVAGQIGSNERMEYTVIGDAVNLASRTEALNKPLGTDILITENTYKLIGKSLIVEEMPSVEVKGKEKPIRLFAVVNMPNAKDIPLAGLDGPQTLSDVRTMLGIIAPDMKKVDLNEDEKKYSIKDS
jgi:adenylate cyclase